MTKLKPYLWLVARFFLAGIFLFAGSIKVLAPVEEFHANILEYGVVPYDLARIVAIVLPWIEVIVAVFLILGFATRASSLILGGLALSFMILISLSYLKFGAVPESCGCFGDGIKLSIPQLFALDLANLAIGIRLFFYKKHLFTLDKFLK